MTAADLDTAALESYLSRELDETVTGADLLADGLNTIVVISTAEAESAYTLRRPNKLRDAGYMTDLATEYRVLELLRDTPVPAPEPVLFCDDASVFDDRFFVVTHLDGEVVPLGSDLPERFRNPEARRGVADGLVDALADVHAVDVERFEGVCEHWTPREQVAQAIDRLDRATEVTGHEVPTLRSVGDWLLANAPSPPERTPVHGDFRPGNVLFGDRPEVTGVLDWESAMLGDPLTELGYLLLRWRDDGDPTPSLDGIEDRHPDDDAIADLREDDERGMAPFTGKPGSPSRRELVARYEERTGISYEHDRFYRAQSAFLLATVWSDLHRHHAERGEDSGLEPYVEYVALLADSIADGEFPL